MSGGGTSISDLTVAKDAAIEKGFTVYQPSPRQLLLDIDDAIGMAQYENLLGLITALFGAKEVARWKSKSGGTHIVVNLTVTLSPEQRIALQAACGSDPKREILAINYQVHGVSEPSCLFRPKGA